MRIYIFILVLCVGLGGVLAFYDEKIELWKKQKEISQIQEEKYIPPAAILEKSVDRKELFLSLLKTDIAEEKLLAVPFVCQNPFMDTEHWEIHDDSCEEASVLQAVLYLQDRQVSAEEADEIFLDMIAWQEQYFGEHKDITSQELEDFTEKYFDFSVNQVFFFPEADADFIKQVIDFGLPVVVPLMASELKNPYYNEQGFHILTTIGYTADGFITNDVGTKRGEKFFYPTERFMQANLAGGGGVLVIWL